MGRDILGDQLADHQRRKGGKPEKLRIVELDQCLLDSCFLSRLGFQILVQLGFVGIGLLAPPGVKGKRKSINSEKSHIDGPRCASGSQQCGTAQAFAAPSDAGRRSLSPCLVFSRPAFFCRIMARISSASRPACPAGVRRCSWSCFGVRIRGMR